MYLYRIMLDYQDNIKTNLQGALEWMRKPENQQPGTTAKLEGRYKLQVFCLVLFCFVLFYVHVYIHYVQVWQTSLVQST